METLTRSELVLKARDMGVKSPSNMNRSRLIEILESENPDLHSMNRTYLEGRAREIGFKALYHRSIPNLIWCIENPDRALPKKALVDKVMELQTRLSRSYIMSMRKPALLHYIHTHSE